MNVRFVLNQLGLLLLVLSATMLIVGGGEAALSILGAIDADWAAVQAMLVSAGIGALVGGALWLATRSHGPHLGRREAIVLVALSWLVGAALAALPFWIWARLHFVHGQPHPFLSFIDCYFESVSGLTTSGSSVLTDIAAVPDALLLWRAATQWIGGIGIIVMFVVVFPTLGVGARRLFQLEASGMAQDGLLPSIRSMARTLLIIYVILTAAQILLLLFAGMSWFDSTCHAFATLATGGFSPRNASVGEFDSAAIDLIITLFMILGGVNFALYSDLYKRRFRTVWRDPELRAYLALLLGCAAIVVITIHGTTIVTSTGQSVHADFLTSIRYALFNVASVQTTTGFATADYDQWPTFARAMMFTVILFGGCAGSTAGGLKIIRVLITGKVLAGLLELGYRPNVVRPIRVGRVAVDREFQLETLGYVIGALAILSVATLALMMLEPPGEIDLTTAASANLATFCTTGPGFGKVGPVANFGWMTDGSKLVLCAVMILGRLEMMALASLVLPRFWRGN